MERYNEYKDSGVQWLGEIPSHWDMQRWRFLLTENKVKNTDCKVKVQLQFKYGDIVRKANQDEDAGVLETISKYTVVAPDDIMINGLNLNYDFISQRVAQVRENGVITSAYVSLRPTSLACSRYYTYFLKSMDFKKMFHGMGTGIRLTLSYNELKNQFIPFPSIAEQQAIADYLDTATAKIDEAIAQQQKMIDLLNERKQIIINNAVTKGLNPDAPMKDSGVDWIGDIPGHWEVLRIRYIGEAKNGLTYSPNDMVDEGNGILVLRSSNIQDGKLAFEDNVYVKGAPEKLWVKKGDIIICSRNGSASLVGKCAIVEEDIYASFGAFMMRFRSEHNSKYTYYLLTAAISHYKQLFATSTINQLTLGIFADIKMPFVYDLQEQTKIAESLDLAIQKFDTAISNATKQISLLQERKQIIINDVVTGKIKVL